MKFNKLKKFLIESIEDKKKIITDSNLFGSFYKLLKYGSGNFKSDKQKNFLISKFYSTDALETSLINTLNKDEYGAIVNSENPTVIAYFNRAGVTRIGRVNKNNNVKITKESNIKDTESVNIDKWHEDNKEKIDFIIDTLETEWIGPHFYTYNKMKSNILTDVELDSLYKLSLSKIKNKDKPLYSPELIEGDVFTVPIQDAEMVLTQSQWGEALHLVLNTQSDKWKEDVKIKITINNFIKWIYDEAGVKKQKDYENIDFDKIKVIEDKFNIDLSILKDEEFYNYSQYIQENYHEIALRVLEKLIGKTAVIKGNFYSSGNIINSVRAKIKEIK
jgi:hypothetical protein